MIDELKELILPILIKENVELVDIAYKREAHRMVLRLLVDKEKGGIMLSECSFINKEISNLLEQENIIQDNYVVEVNSPGIDRLFKTKRDYERAINKYVKVMLSERVLDKKEYDGKLVSLGKDTIKLDTEKKGIIEIPFSKIAKARAMITM